MVRGLISRFSWVGLGSVTHPFSAPWPVMTDSPRCRVPLPLARNPRAVEPWRAIAPGPGTGDDCQSSLSRFPCALRRGSHHRGADLRDRRSVGSEVWVVMTWTHQSQWFAAADGHYPANPPLPDDRESSFPPLEAAPMTATHRGLPPLGRTARAQPLCQSARRPAAANPVRRPASAVPE